MDAAQPPDDPVLDGRKPAQNVGYLTDAFSDRAAAYIRRPHTQPFFLVLAYNAAQMPAEPLARDVERISGIPNPLRLRYAAVVSTMDAGIGRVLAALREQKLEDDTIVIFTSDNGGATLPPAAPNGAVNAPLRGSKRQTYEGGIRVPLLMQWKARVPAGATFSRPVSLLDIVPTVLHASGARVAATPKLDGVNLLPFVTSSSAEAPHDMLFWRFGSAMAVRRANWKLVRSVEPSGVDDLSDAELYNLAEDVSEKNNLAAKQPDVVQQLTAAWRAWNRDLGPPLWKGEAVKPGTLITEMPPPVRRITRTAAPKLRPLSPAKPGTGSWPSFRGPGASGTVDGINLPDKWDGKTGDNVLWRVAIPGLGHSSPVVWGDRIFVTSAVSTNPNAMGTFKPGLYGAGDASEDRSSQRFVVYAIDTRTGKIVWERTAFEGPPVEKRHTKSTYASATPATDGRIVVAWFGSQGVYAYDVDGTFRWKVDLGHLDLGAYDVPDLEWGTASSPLIWNDLVFLQCDTDHDDFLLAVNAATGETVWKVDRDELPSWGTPTVVETGVGPQLVTNSPNFIRAYDPKTGKELWRLGRSSKITAPTPFIAEGMIVVASGRGPERPISVVRPSARGDITPPAEATMSDAIVWSRTGRGSYMPTPLAYKGILYVLNNNGTFDAYDLKTGDEVYRARVNHPGLGFSASPVAADGKIYAPSEDGEIITIAAGPKFETLATNSIGELLMATPALSDGVMYVRGASTLFAIGRKR